jgi:hypothetical protein
MCLLKVLVLEWVKSDPGTVQMMTHGLWRQIRAEVKNRLEFSACSAAGGYQFCDPEGAPPDRKQCLKKQKRRLPEGKRRFV